MKSEIRLLPARKKSHGLEPWLGVAISSVGLELADHVAIGPVGQVGEHVCVINVFAAVQRTPDIVKAMAWSRKIYNSLPLSSCW